MYLLILMQQQPTGCFSYSILQPTLLMSVIVSWCIENQQSFSILHLLRSFNTACICYCHFYMLKIGNKHTIPHYTVRLSSPKHSSSLSFFIQTTRLSRPQNWFTVLTRTCYLWMESIIIPTHHYFGCNCSLPLFSKITHNKNQSRTILQIIVTVSWKMIPNKFWQEHPHKHS